MLAQENMFSDVQEAARSVLIFGVGIFGRLFYCTENFVAWCVCIGIFCRTGNLIFVSGPEEIFERGAADMKNMTRAAPLLVILILLGIWELTVRVGQIPLYVLPSPSATVFTLAEEFPTLLRHTGITVLEALTGMGISFAVGIIIGILIDAMPTFKRCIYPILVVTQTVPVIVLAPIFIIYMGFGYAPKILTVVLMCFFPIVVSFSDGLGQMEEGYLNLLRTYGGSRFQLYRIVKIPSAVISLLSGLKVAATYSISGAVVGEWIA